MTGNSYDQGRVVHATEGNQKEHFLEPFKNNILIININFLCTTNFPLVLLSKEEKAGNKSVWFITAFPPCCTQKTLQKRRE